MPTTDGTGRCTPWLETNDPNGQLPYVSVVTDGVHIFASPFDAWEEHLNLPALPLSQTLLVNGDTLVALGGLNSANAASDEVYAATIVGDTLSDWEAKPPLARPRVFATPTLVDGELFLLGGQNGAGGFVLEIERATLDATGAPVAWTDISVLPIGRALMEARVTATSQQLAGGGVNAAPVIESSFGADFLTSWTEVGALTIPKTQCGSHASGFVCVSLTTEASFEPGEIEALDVSPGGAFVTRRLAAMPDQWPSRPRQPWRRHRRRLHLPPRGSGHEQRALRKIR